MIGFAVGIACLWGLFRVLRGGRGPWHRGGRGCHGGRRWGFMRGLFDDLDTTSAQERVIKDAVGEVKRAAEDLRDGVFDAKGEVADAFRQDQFDAEAMAEVLSRFDDKLDELRKSFVGALARVHETLDADQRAELARLMGRARRRWGGPYRSHA